ncbi:MAG: ABC transporter permease, partial [Acetobacteraceae bacterium]|nr:ABC transporter permease [Acetobacteraceae bacterium]
MLLVAVIGLHVLKPKGLSYFDLSSTAASAAPLVLAAIGETVVVIAGGLDLSVGAVLSLVNVTLVSVLGVLPLETPIYAAAAVALAAVIGAVAGTLNGAFVGYLGVTPVVATLG